MKIQVKNLVRTFRNTRAVDDISFGFHEGQIYGFVGPNGAGKTTTMRIMATLDEPTSGDVLIDGVSLVENPEEARKRVGFVPDTLPEHRDITIDEYLDFFARAGGLTGSQRIQVVEDVEVFTGVMPYREKQLNELSKGMKQRVSLARALIHDPDLLIMDEPAAGLDPKARIELRELILALAAQGKAILISSHILDELGELCDGVVIIENGRLIHAGSLDEIFEEEGAKVTLWVRPLEDITALPKILLEQPHVEKADIIGSEVRVKLQATDEECASLLRFLIERNFRIAEFRKQKGDLEEAYMHVTGGLGHE